MVLRCCVHACLQGGQGGGSFQGRHTTDAGPGMQSVLERNDLDELMAMVRRDDSCHMSDWCVALCDCATAASAGYGGA